MHYNVVKGITKTVMFSHCKRKLRILQIGWVYEFKLPFHAEVVYCLDCVGGRSTRSSHKSSNMIPMSSSHMSLQGGWPKDNTHLMSNICASAEAPRAWRRNLTRVSILLNGGLWDMAGGRKTCMKGMQMSNQHCRCFNLDIAMLLSTSGKGAVVELVLTVEAPGFYQGFLCCG